MAPGKFILFLLLVTTSSQAAFSQSAYDPWILTSTPRQEKLDQLDSVMRFTAKEARLFWPLYNQYMWKWEKLMSERISLIQDNVMEEDHERPKKKEFIRSLFRNDMALTRLQKKYYTRFRKALSASKANQFMQIEYETQNRIRVMEQNIFYL